MKLSLIILMIMLISCGGSKELETGKQPKKKAELDALFGISDQDAQGDDELLTLLDNQRKNEPQKEIVLGEEDKIETTSKVVVTKPVVQQNNNSAKIAELENKVKLQGEEISMLRSENNRLTNENSDLRNRKPEVVYTNTAVNSSGDYKDD